MNSIWMMIVFYVLLADSLIANLIAWTARDWYVKRFQLMARVFPLTKGWAVVYLALVLYIGWLTFY